MDDSDAASENDEHDEVGLSEDNADVTWAQLEVEEQIHEIDNSSLEEEEDAADSNAEDFDSDAASTGSAPKYSPESPLLQEVKYIEEVQATPAEQDQLSPSMLGYDFPAAAESPYSSRQTSPHPQTFSSPGWRTINTHVTFPSDIFDNAVAPPLPPRPSQKRQKTWDESQHEDQDWMSSGPPDHPSWASLDGSVYEFRAPPLESMSTTPPAAERSQTPPHTVSAEATAAASALVDLTTHSTGGPIIEMVDEQPLTPTSIDSRKRSADDAFDEETEAVVELMATEPIVEQLAAQEVAPQPQRPIAQPKSILRRALNAAKVMVPATALGAVFTVGALTALPESFFTVV